MKRIVTAREQVEMLSPWKQAATDVDEIMDLLGVPSKPRPVAPAPVPAQKYDHYKELRENYKDIPPGKLPYDVMIPTKVLDHYREYSHPYDHKLEEIIRDQGIRQPVRISTDGNHAILSEGNHRLDVALKLGIPEIPARVFLGDDILRGDVDGTLGGKAPAPLENFLKDFISKNHDKLESWF